MGPSRTTDRSFVGSSRGPPVDSLSLVSHFTFEEPERRALLADTPPLSEASDVVTTNIG